MPLMLHNGKLLLVEGKLAVSEDCCCGGCTGCLSATVPESMQIDITGVDTVQCGSNCSSFNGTFILTRTNFLTYFTVDTPGFCSWYYPFPSPIGCSPSGNFLGLTMSVSAIDCRVAANFDGSLALMFPGWASTASGYRDCASFASFSLNWFSPGPGTGGCYTNASSCLVTAL